jgi:hypothetical protein
MKPDRGGELGEESPPSPPLFRPRIFFCVWSEWPWSDVQFLVSWVIIMGERGGGANGETFWGMDGWMSRPGGPVTGYRLPLGLAGATRWCYETGRGRGRGRDGGETVAVC